MLKQIHDEIDEAVLEAYGAWASRPTNPMPQQGGTPALPIADRLARGQIRYLRPDFQDPDYGKKREAAEQGKLEITPAEKVMAQAAVVEKLPWPKTTVERVANLKQLLQTLPAEAEVLSGALKGSNTKRRREDIEDLLATLASLGQL